MIIRRATPEDQNLWDSYVWHHPHAVAYHQFAWGQAVKAAYNFEPFYYIAEREAKIVGVLPVIKLKVPLRGSSFVSLPYCDLGGILADDDEIAVALQRYVITQADKYHAQKIELRQSSTEQNSLAANKVRMVLTLPDSSETLLSGFKAKLRSQVRKPIKDGLTAELGGLNLLDDFYDIMKVNMRDLGSPIHSQRWFYEIVQHYGEKARIGIVRSPKGKAIGGGIILLHNDRVSIPWASTLREYNRLNPNMLLYWTFLSYAADSGFKTFDFGRSTPGEGTYRFKEQWGAQALALEWTNLLASPLSEDVTSGSLRQTVETLWQKLPVRVSTFLGSRLRRYIDL
jgi:FemAB-related protein (PEP-CTERM system-associated)